MYIGRINNNIKKVIKDKIIEILIRAKINNFREILTKTFLDRIRDTNSNINKTGADKLEIDYVK